MSKKPHRRLTTEAVREIYERNAKKEDKKSLVRAFDAAASDLLRARARLKTELEQHQREIFDALSRLDDGGTPNSADLLQNSYAVNLALGKVVALNEHLDYLQSLCINDGVMNENEEFKLGIF